MSKSIEYQSSSSSWLGWVGFASFMLLLGGIFSGLMGFVALFNNTIVYQSVSSSVWLLDFTQWGWVHIIVGIIAIAGAGSLLSGKMFGRIIAVLAAFISAIANMMFLPISPLWSIICIVVDILIIYAVIVHAGELREEEAM